MPTVDLLAEAERQMTICNSCRYCEGFCAVFPAMETTRAVADRLERIVADDLWPLPKYAEMLFIK